MNEEVNEILEIFETKKISIIFGGAGFIGSALTKKLLADESSKVIVIDKDKEALSKLEDNANLITKEINLNDSLDSLDFLNEYYEEENGQNVTLYLFASSLGPEKVSKENNIPDYLLNFNMYHYLTRIIISKKLKFKRIIFSSTSEVYGNQENMDENSDVLIDLKSEGHRPQYALQKLTAENLLLNLGKDLHQEVIITRLFNIVGKGQKEGFIISNFNKIFKQNLDNIKSNISVLNNNPECIEDILKNNGINKFKIYGNGTQSRVFTSIEDTVEIYSKLSTYIESSSIPPEDKIINNIINIACIKNNITVMKLVQKYLDFYKSIFENILEDPVNDFNESQLQYIKQLINDVKAKEPFYEKIDNGNIGQLKRSPTVFKLYKVLNYKPVKNLNNIIRESLF